MKLKKSLWFNFYICKSTVNICCTASAYFIVYLQDKLFLLGNGKLETKHLPKRKCGGGNQKSHCIFG